VLKKVIALSLVTLLVVVMAIGGTWAFMKDSGKSANNRISAKTLNLKLGYDPGTGVVYSNSLTQQINVNLKPSQSTPESSIWLQNDNYNSTGIYASRVNMRFKYSKSQDGPVIMSADSLAQIIQVSVLDYDRGGSGQVNLLNNINDALGNSNGIKDLQDLQTLTNNANPALNGLAAINLGQSKKFVIQLKLRDKQSDDVTPIANLNNFQGNGLNLFLIFTLVQ
jgi:hypothetical protein